MEFCEFSFYPFEAQASLWKKCVDLRHLLIAAWNFLNFWVLRSISVLLLTVFFLYSSVLGLLKNIWKWTQISAFIWHLDYHRHRHQLFNLIRCKTHKFHQHRQLVQLADKAFRADGHHSETLELVVSMLKALYHHHTFSIKPMKIYQVAAENGIYFMAFFDEVLAV